MPTPRIAINGFGRIGRNFFRAAKGTNVATDLRAALMGVDVKDVDSVRSAWSDVTRAFQGPGSWRSL